jgi:hypothetical protein
MSVVSAGLLCCRPQVHPAPGPEEVNWQSLWFNHQQRVLRGWLTAPFAVIVVLLPVSGLTSAISMLNSEVRGCWSAAYIAQQARGDVALQRSCMQ